MAKDFLVSLVVGGSMAASAKTVFRSTIKRLDDLGKTIKANEQASARIAGYRKLEKGLGETQAAARKATERVAKLGAAMRKTEKPSKAMRLELGQARREARRFTDRVGEQTRALDEGRRALRQAKIDVRDLARAEREVGAALDRQRKQFDRLSASRARQAGAREKRSAMRGQLAEAAVGVYGLIRGLRATVGEAIRFESVMADVRKVVDFETPEQFRAMGRDIRLLSTRLPVAATGIGEIVAAAGQAGIARHELLRFTEDATKMAVAFDMSAGEAGSAMTGMRAIFKLSQSEVMDLAGAYNHLSNNMDATAADMLRVANRAGPTAQQMFRLTGQELGALGATFLALKTPPEVAGTAINAMLTKLATADEQGEGFRDALDEIGLSAGELREAIERDGQGALLSFLEAVDQAEDKQSVLFRLFGQEYVDDVAKLTGGLGLYRKALGLSSATAADASSIQREYAERAATTGNALQLLRNRFDRLGGAIGDAFLPGLRDGTGLLGRMIDTAADLSERFPGATRIVTGLSAALVGFKVGAIGLSYAKTYVVDFVEGVKTVGYRLGDVADIVHARFWGIRSTLASLGRGVAPPALGVLRGIASAVRSPRRALRSLGSVLATAGAGVTSPILGTLQGIASAVRSPRRAVGGLGRALGTLRSAAIPAAIRGLKMLRLALIGTGIGAIVVGIGLAAGLLIKYWEPVTAFFAGMWRGIKSALQPLADAFAWLAPLGEAISNVFGALFGPIETTSEQMENFGSVGERVGKTIGTAFRVLLWPVSKLVEGIGWGLKFLGIANDDPPDLMAAAPPSAAPRRAAGGAMVGLALAGAPAAATSDPSALTGPGAAVERSTPAASKVVLAPPPDLGAAPVFEKVEAAPVDAAEIEEIERLTGGQPLTPEQEAAFSYDGRADQGAPSALPGRPVTVNVTVGDIVIHAPAGADTTEIAREIERQLADVMRRAADQARLAETDGL